MKFTVHYDPESRHLVARLIGALDKKTIGQYARAIVQAGTEHNCKNLLNDISQVKVDLSVADIFFLPELLDSVGIDSTWKRAVVTRGNHDIFRFLETRMINESHPVKIFQDQEAAVTWLSSGGEDD